MPPPRVNVSYQPFPQLNSAIAVPDAHGVLLCGPAWQRLFIRMWILSGAKIIAQPNAAVVGQTALGNGAPLGVFDSNTGVLIGTIFLTNQPGKPAIPQLPFPSGDVFIATQDGFWVVSSGQVEVSRNVGVTWQQVSLTGATLPLSNGDRMRVSYDQVQPTVVEYPSGGGG